MHPVQQETSGMTWNQCLVLSSKALPHQVYESSCLAQCRCRTGTAEHTGEGKHFLLKKFNIQKMLQKAN